MKSLLLAGTLALLGPGLALAQAQPAQNAARTGNVIFFHPDGSGLNHWTALRYLQHGPDGLTNWDRLPGMALYGGHMKDSLTGTSNGGATVHAYGVRVSANSFGQDGPSKITALSGKPQSIAQEALAAGKAVGLIQTGHIAEPGTAAFVSSVERRGNTAQISRDVIESGVQVIMAGGERFLLPKGVRGRFGEGEREDGRNLIERARELGYTVVFTREELMAVDRNQTQRLLGVFALNHTFNDQTEERNRERNAPEYTPSAPTIAEMAEVALAILSRDPDGFFLVAEEEGTDNFANRNNAKGQMEALRRADAAIGVFNRHIERSPNTLMLMTADSEAGGLQVLGAASLEGLAIGKQLPERDENGAPLDGAEGTKTEPFVSAADRAGVRHPFAISWGAADDTSGNILVRANGLNSEMVRGVIDNIGIYRLMHRTLFGSNLM
jgi:alkaline phosphatase